MSGARHYSRALRPGLFLCVALAGMTVPLSLAAQTQLIAFRIPPGKLDDALRTYALISGRKILFRARDVRDLRFAGIDATANPEAVLTAMLADTGLVAEHPSPGVVIVRRPTETGVTSNSLSAEPVASDDIVITGTNIRGGETGGPVRTLSRDDLARSGKATVAELIAAQTANFGGAGNPVASLAGTDQTSLNFSLASAANLRGIGPDATLTLFDGRRVAGSGGRGDFTDLSAIPSLAVDRVEILTDGASAIYGSDAVAGVVNLRLRHRFDGVETRLRGSLATRGEPWNALGAIAAGKTWANGSIIAAYDYERRERLSSADRRYTATGDLRPFGGSDRRTYYASPGNILTFNPATGGYVPSFAIPALNRQPVVADILPGQNPGNLYAMSDLSPRIERHALYGRVEQSLGDTLDAFIEARFAHRAFDYVSPASVTVLNVTPNNPFYLPVAGRPSTLIGYSFLGDLGPAEVVGKVSALALTAGFNWTAGDWTIDGYGSFARERSRDRSGNQLNSTALAEALGNTPDNPLTSYDPRRDGFFNPYGSGSANPAATLAFIGSGYADARRRSSLGEALLRAEGPLLSLPGGDVRLAIGGSYRRETFRSDAENFYSGITPTSTPGVPGARNIVAEFAELQVPIVGRSNAAAGLRKLTLVAAARHEDYADFGTTTNPKLGLIYSPAEGFTLRASYGTSFRAPALSEVNDRLRVVATALPDASGRTIPVLFQSGGNPDLGPEQANTISGGFVLESSAMKGLRFEVNLFRTRFDDRIAQPALEDFSRALSNPALATFVRQVSPATNADDLAAVIALLNQPGAVVGSTPATGYGAIVDGRFVNTASLEVSGLDGDISLTRPIGRGQLNLSLSATWLFAYRQQLTPLSASIDRLDTLGNPVSLKVRGSAGWSQGPWSATVIGNFTDSYRDDVSAAPRRIASFFTADTTLAYAPPAGPLKGLRFSLAIENLLDADPPFVDRVNGFGFDAASASPFGRVVALELRHSW